MSRAVAITPQPHTASKPVFSSVARNTSEPPPGSTHRRPPSRRTLPIELAVTAYQIVLVAGIVAPRIHAASRAPYRFHHRTKAPTQAQLPRMTVRQRPEAPRTRAPAAQTPHKARTTNRTSSVAPYAPRASAGARANGPAMDRNQRSARLLGRWVDIDDLTMIWLDESAEHGIYERVVARPMPPTPVHVLAGEEFRIANQ